MADAPRQTVHAPSRNPCPSKNKQGRSPCLPRRSNLESSDGIQKPHLRLLKGTTIDAIGQGQYLVCRPSGCTKVQGLHNAHAALRQQDSEPQ